MTACRPANSPAETFFLDGQRGRLYCTYFAPRSPDTGLHVLMVPPWAEELNKARRLLALQARSLAVSGIGALMLDLFGTGDSEGDFRQATWPLWLENLTAGVEWLRQRRATRVGLLGVRSGALLAKEWMVGQTQATPIAVFWQPTAAGSTVITQFLRLRTAASAFREGTTETVKELKAKLAAGESIEVAGYELNADLARDVAAARLDQAPPTKVVNVHWFELGTVATDSIAPASERVAEQWRSNGIAVTSATFAGQPFWDGNDITESAQLVASTTRAFATEASA